MNQMKRKRPHIIQIENNESKNSSNSNNNSNNTNNSNNNNNNDNNNNISNCVNSSFNIIKGWVSKGIKFLGFKW
jgi:hypothetical protein